MDISPPFRPDEIDRSKFERLKRRFDENVEPRQFRDVDGTPLAFGELRDLSYEKAVLQSNAGPDITVPIGRLSEADLAYISDKWGLPTECLIRQERFAPRRWTATAMTFTASNLCHTPLYFEDVNLERYGHTRGPLLEPLVQTAHFFGGVFVLPYKMGVQHPRECIYTLGYYRPGSCAPWITPPVPLSLRGGLYQAAAMTGVGLVLP